MIEIIDIKPEGTKQGTTRPLLCEGSDRRKYVVKNRRAGTRGLISEYVGGRLARLINLPVPDFEILYMRKDLAQFSVHVDAKGMALLPSFGSCYIDDAVEISDNYLRTVPDDLRARILLFDWWIANGDRRGWGKPLQWNPNLLWIPTQSKLMVIDHNMAFERWNVDEPSNFWKSHVFAESAALWDAAFKAAMIHDMTAAAEELDSIWSELPLEWIGVEEIVTKQVVSDLIWRFSTDAVKFWSRSI